MSTDATITSATRSANTGLVAPPFNKSVDCLNCGTATMGQFCHACGQKVQTHRFSLPVLLHEIPHSIFHVDRGLFITLKRLFSQPGIVINDYLEGRRARYFNPFTLLVILAGLSGLLYTTYPFVFSVQMPDSMTPEMQVKFKKFLGYAFKYYSWSLIAFTPLMAGISWFCFLGAKRNFGEHLVCSTFMFAGSTALLILAFPVLAYLNGTKWFAPTWLALGLVMLAYWCVVCFAVHRKVLHPVSAATRSLLVCVTYSVVGRFLQGIVFGFTMKWL